MPVDEVRHGGVECVGALEVDRVAALNIHDLQVRDFTHRQVTQRLEGGLPGPVDQQAGHGDVAQVCREFLGGVQ